MTRKTIPGVGVIFPSTRSDRAGMVDPTIYRPIISDQFVDAQIVELHGHQITLPSPGADAESPSSPSHRTACKRSHTPSQSDSSSDCPGIGSLCPTCALDPNPQHALISLSMGSDKAKMAQVFDINQRPPFQDPLVTLGVQRYDVIKIKNVPFSVTIAEIKSFVSRLTSAPLIKDHIQGYPVHIVMERPTGKTMDCFVEFQNQGSAKSAVLRADQLRFEGKVLKIGSRHVDVEQSHEGELSAALFPRAKSVLWDRDTGIPTVVDNQDPYSDGFQGFFTIEEMSSVCRHAANPQKSTFNQRCQQRVYESMISTMYKFPWHAPQLWSINARNILWSTYIELLDHLVSKVFPSEAQCQSGNFEKEVGLSHNLLLDYVFAGLNVQMFSLRQKFMITEVAGPVGLGCLIVPQSAGWPFQTLVPMPQCPQQLLDQWLYIMDLGHGKCVLHKIRHGHENYMKISRDGTDCLKVELNDAGRALTFADVTSMEKSVLDLFLLHGREELRRAWNIPPQPTGSLDHETGAVVPISSSNSIELVGNALTAKSADDNESDNASDVYGPLVPNGSDYVVYDYEENAIQKVVNRKPRDEPTAHKAPPRNIFNPATPSFIPRQPWTGGNSVTRQGVRQPASVPSQPSTSDPSFALTPSWSTTQELPYSGAITAAQTSTPNNAQQPGSTTETAPFDPFSGDLAAYFDRATSLSTSRSATASSGNGDTWGAASGDIASGVSVSNNFPPPRPSLGSIWAFPGPGEPPRVLPIKRASPRRTISAGSATTNDELGASSSDNYQSFLRAKLNFGNDTPALSSTSVEFESPKAPEIQFRASTWAKGSGGTSTQPSKTVPAHGMSPLPQPRLSSGNDVARAWGSGSPTRGLRNRSSASRNAFTIQATIAEESDASANETTEEGDDAATGGVSLQD